MARSTKSLVIVVMAAASVGCQFHAANNGSAGAGGAGTGVGGGHPPGLGGFGGGTNGDGSQGTSSPDSNCASVNQGAVPLPPDILIIQDKSGSMNQLPDGSSCGNNCGTMSKWSQVTAALNQVVGMTDTTVNWGLKFFSDNNACGATAAPVVPVATGNATAIANAIRRTNPGGNTPTRDAVQSGGTYLAGLTDTNPKYLLLATDGLPNCPAGCSLTNPSTACTMTDNPAEDMAATQAIATVFSSHIPTFVVGIGATGADATLNAFANAGGVPQTGAATSFYQVTDTASLVAVLGTILGRVASCKFNIGTAPNSMTSVDYIDVYGDGVLISQDTTHTDGWDYTNAAHTAIEIYGPKCNAITAGTLMNVTVTFRCIVP